MKTFTKPYQSEQIDVFANVRHMGPAPLLEFLDQLMYLFPEELRYRLKQVVDSLPREGDNMQKVLEVVRNQWRDIQSESWVKIAVTGPPQTGKTSLVNAILRKQAPDSEPIFNVSESPVLQEFLGFPATDFSEGDYTQADLILFVLDARFSVSDLTLQSLSKLQESKVPVLVVLNKIDLAEDPSAAVRDAKKTLQVSPFPTSAHDSESISKLLKAIVVANPKTLYPLARCFPEFRRTLCNGTIGQAAFASSLVSVIPIPVSDLLPITAIQTSMILKIARAFGCEIDRRRARELVPMLLAGIAVREAGHRLRRRFPRHRSLISVSVAGGWTFALGRLAVRYFDRSSVFLRGESQWEDEAEDEAACDSDEGRLAEEA